MELKLNSKWMHNRYVVSLPLPPTGNGDGEDKNPVLEMKWKGTNEVKGFTRKMDRGMHHKLGGEEQQQAAGALCAQSVEL